MSQHERTTPRSPAEVNSNIAAQAEGDEAAVDIVGLLLMLWRLKLIILGVASVIMVVGLTVMLMIVPRYTASVMISVGLPVSQVVNVEAVLQGVPMDTLRIGTEVQILRSRSLVERVVTELDLVNDPQFNPALVPKEEKSSFAWLNPVRWIEGYDDNLSEEMLSDEEMQQRQRARVVDRVMATISARQTGLSYIITVEVETINPRTAMQIANAVANQYLVAQMEAKFGATERATEWLNDRIADLRDSVEASERAVEDYRVRIGLIKGGESPSLSNQQISQVNGQLILARTEQAAAQARLKQVERLMATNGGSSGGDNLESPLIQGLRSQSATLTREAAELAEEYGVRHPRMISLQAEIRDTEAQIAAEIQNIIQRYRNEADIATSRRMALETSLDELKGEVAEQNRGSVQMRTLEREASARRALYETFLSRFQETTVQEDLQQADADIIAYAQVPVSPSYPKKVPYGLVLIFISFLGGVGVAFLAHLALDRGVRTIDDLETVIGLPCLAALPQLTDGKDKDPVAHAIKNPKSRYSEALRSLHTNIELAAIDDDPKVIVFTSAIPGEGKTSVSSSYAALMAMSGRKVLLIDTDLRRSRVHKVFGIDPSPGIVELLAESNDWSKVVKTDPETGLDIIPAGTRVVSPQDVLGSQGMRDFLTKAREQYDLIVLDTPPANVVSETLHLASQADRVILLVKWSTTHRDIMRQAKKLLDGAGTRYAGVVLSQMGAKAQTGYGYSGYSGYGYTYSSYYKES
jgi:polysaccharide biosynthesis transport protein